MKRSGSTFILAAATIAVGAMFTLTAPTALADRTTGPTINSGTPSADNRSPVGPQVSELSDAEMAEIVRRMQEAAKQP